MKILTCSPQTALNALQNGAVLLDVREKGEWAAVHVEGTQHLPLGALRADPSQIATPEVYVLCRSGHRATEAARLLATHGISYPIVIQGGLLAWQAAGLPVQRRERPALQQRPIVVFTGTLAVLGLTAPALRPLGILAGAALIISGVFDWRGMDVLLAKMLRKEVNKPAEGSR